MKKSIFIGAMALITLAACQKESNELQNEVQKEKAEIFVKTMTKQTSEGRPAQIDNSVYVQCNTDWQNITGTSCIWSGGMLFQVGWSTIPLDGGGVTHAYSTQQVSHCSCGN